MSKGNENIFKKRFVKLLKSNEFTLIILIAVGLTVTLKTVYSQWKITDFTAYPVKTVEYLKQHTDVKNIRLYNEYDFGGYLLFNDIKVFIDPRADLYTDSYNPGCTVFDDYMKTYIGKEDYKDCFKKYAIEYILIYKNSTANTYLQHDSDYVPLYSDDRFMLYKARCP